MNLLKTLTRKVWRGVQHSAAALAAVGLVAAFVPTTASADGTDASGPNSLNYSGGFGAHNYSKHRGDYRAPRHERNVYVNRDRNFHVNRERNVHVNRGYDARSVNRQRHVDRRYYDRGRDYRYSRNYNGHNGHNGYRRNNNGNAVAAGIVGLAAGAIIASEISRSRRVNSGFSGGSYEPFTAEWYRACARKYRSFNPDTGRYVTHGGERRLCRL